MDCRRCRVVGRTRVQGLSCCEICREKIRIQNLQRRGAKRQWERKNYGHRPLAEVKYEQDIVHETAKRLVLRFAQEKRYVPSCLEVARIVGRKGGGQVRRDRNGPANLRRVVFGLAPLGSRHNPDGIWLFRGQRIPYPVPEKYLARTRTPGDVDV